MRRYNIMPPAPDESRGVASFFIDGALLSRTKNAGTCRPGFPARQGNSFFQSIISLHVATRDRQGFKTAKRINLQIWKTASGE
jgi:hypothetical protein